MSNRNSFIESTKETDKRLEALKQLYPEIFSDGKINLDALNCAILSTQNFYRFKV